MLVATQRCLAPISRTGSHRMHPRRRWSRCGTMRSKTMSAGRRMRFSRATGCWRRFLSTLPCSGTKAFTSTGSQMVKVEQRPRRDPKQQGHHPQLPASKESVRNPDVVTRRGKVTALKSLLSYLESDGRGCFPPRVLEGSTITLAERRIVVLVEHHEHATAHLDRVGREIVIVNHPVQQYLPAISN